MLLAEPVFDAFRTSHVNRKSGSAKERAMSGSETITKALACQEDGESPPTIVIILREIKNRGYYSATVGSIVLFKRHNQPEFAAARALHKLGYGDETLLITRREGSTVDCMRGRLGVWRQWRVREDSLHGPRFVKYEPFPKERVGKRRTKR
jgi:hypothetical protein